MVQQTKNPGPDPERLTIDEAFEDAVKKALKKRKPKDGWPDQQRKRTSTGDAD